MRYDDFQWLRVAVEDGIALVTLSNPSTGNAVTYESHLELGRILPALSDDASVRTVLVAADGPDFCVGPSPEIMRRLAEDGPAFGMSVMVSVERLVRCCVDFDKPVVSAINGRAAGGPLVFAMLADVVIAERDVRFSDTHVRNGVVAGDGGILVWPMALGLLRAKRYLLTGAELTATDAERYGLVTEVADVGQGREVALRYARELASMPETAVRYTKRALNEWLRAAMPAFTLGWAGEILTATGPATVDG
ncbi:MAG: enoyl-CoA hydratase [Actinomycetia bacterium]|nr:enoyl-CoA hydratase [Actinomycetes bacterium]